jgi:glucose/arabinose dehydrogenase
VHPRFTCRPAPLALAALFVAILVAGCSESKTVAGEPHTATPIPAPTERPRFDPTTVAALEAADDRIQRRDQPYIYAPLPPGYRLETVTSGLTGPAAFDGAADGRIFVVEQFSGIVRVIENGAVRQDPYFTVSDLHTEAERGFVSELGLVGLTVEPGSSPVSLLLYYSGITAEGERSTKLVRVRDENGRGILGETLLEIPLASGCCHIGGGLTWLADGTLLVGVGDHEQAALAQSLSSPAGKVLRITPDGLPPADNPYVGNVWAEQRMFAMGLRNPFGVAADPQGRMYVLDNGEIGFDRVYELREKGNYNWPSSEVPDGVETEEALQTYQESLGLASAVVYRGPLAAFDGDLFFCQFHRGGALHWFPITDDPLDVDRILAGGCSSAIRVLPDGWLYFVDYFDGTMYRIASG